MNQMKGTLLFLALIAGGAGSAAAQETRAADSTAAESCRLDKSVLEPLLRQAFAGLVSPQSNATVGNYAALDLKEAEVTFAGTVIFGKGSVLGIKLHGGVADGFLPIFSHSKLNSQFGGDVQYSFLDGWTKHVLYDLDVCARYYTLLRKLAADSALKDIELKSHFAATLIQLEIARLDSVARALGDRLPTATGARKDSIAVALQRIASSRHAQTELYEREMAADSKTQGRQQRNWFNTESGKLADSISLKGFRMGWFSLGYGTNNTSFRLFDPSLPFDSQVSKRSFLSHTVRAQYSYYNLSPAASKSYYWSVGGAFSVEDNLADLTKVELTETTSFGPNPNDRVATKKFNAFQGAYAKNLKSLTIFGDFYHFLFLDNKAALHLYPEYVFKESLSSAGNLGVGFLLAFKNKDKLTTIFNSEAYIKFNDVLNHNHAEEGPLQRSSFGFRFTFPINFPSAR